MSGGWEVLRRRKLLDCSPWVKIYAETVRLEDGRTVIDDFYMVETTPYVVIFALTPQHTVPMIEHYRHAHKRVVMELPAGGIDPGEEPLACAKRELLEETGLKAERWESLGDYVVDPNQGHGSAHLYLALDAVPVAPPHPGDLQQQTLHFLTLDQLRDHWLSKDCATLASSTTIGLGLAHLERLSIDRP
jgi:ADP-ribose pyrophosphatase